MILIISSEDDISTTRVIDWLRFQNQGFLRISSSDKVQIDTIDLEDLSGIKFTVKGSNYSLSDFSAVWYRRSWLITNFNAYNALSNSDLNKVINQQLFTENKAVSDFFLKTLETKSLNSQLQNNLNKLGVLQICKQFEIVTPKTIVTTNKETVVNFKELHGEIITKNLSPGVFVNTEDLYSTIHTKVVTDRIIDEMGDTFYPALFQELIPKAFEVRAFYLDGEFYACAIFSQSDEGTKIDFRNYNELKPNRTPPFSLPADLKEKLIKLMTNLNLKSGSIDLIVTQNGQFIFLEVNPIGQYFQVSHPCNYNLDKKIANFLTKQNG